MIFICACLHIYKGVWISVALHIRFRFDHQRTALQLVQLFSFIRFSFSECFVHSALHFYSSIARLPLFFSIMRVFICFSVAYAQLQKENNNVCIWSTCRCGTNIRIWDHSCWIPMSVSVVMTHEHWSKIGFKPEFYSDQHMMQSFKWISQQKKNALTFSSDKVHILLLCYRNETVSLCVRVWMLWLFVFGPLFFNTVKLRMH